MNCDHWAPNRQPARSGFVGWPNRRHLAFCVTVGAALTAWFYTVYGATSYVTSVRAMRVDVAFDFERNIPFVGAMLPAYMSIYPLLWLAPFVLRSRPQLLALAAAMAWTIAVAGAVFLLLPAELEFDTPNVPAHWQALYGLADTLNLQYNLLPSLHVALSILCVDVYCRRAPTCVRLLFWLWGFAIASSTLLTHQHHLLDVLSGAVLGLVASRMLYWRRTNVAASAPPESATATR